MMKTVKNISGAKIKAKKAAKIHVRCEHELHMKYAAAVRALHSDTISDAITKHMHAMIALAEETVPERYAQDLAGERRRYEKNRRMIEGKKVIDAQDLPANTKPSLLVVSGNTPHDS